MMSIPCKFERSILSYDEHEIILRSHHPEIYDLGLDDLKALRQRHAGGLPGTTSIIVRTNSGLGLAALANSNQRNSNPGMDRMARNMLRLVKHGSA
jgi:hypothetical protein